MKDESIREYTGEGGTPAPLAVIILGFETDYRKRKVVENGETVEKLVPADKVIIGKIADPQYQQQYWISRLAAEKSDNPQLWNELVKPAYEGWKRGEGLQAQGTPLAILGSVPPRVIQQYRTLNIHTVEHLAAVTDADLPRLGLEGRSHRDLAAKFVAAQGSETAKIAARQQEQEDMIARQQAQIAELQAALAANRQPKKAA